MKKIVSIILIAVLAVSIASVLVACGGDRENELRIANWGEYMSSEVYLGFEEWYLEKTGNTIKVQYEEFDTNENLYTWISAKHEDYDLICPSDYMLQRMKTEGLLQKLSDETISVLNAKINPDVINMVKNSYDSEFAYTMPYVWGTLGIMFNVNSDGTVGLQNELDVMSNWSVLWNNSYKDKIFMKDSVRDAYTVATIYDKSAQLNEYLGADKNYDNADYQALLQSIFSTTDANMIARAKTLLLQQKANVYDYEVDSAKDELLRDVDGKNGRLGLFWSCDAGYIMNGDSTVNKNLYYTVPTEGSNVWVDGFAIPKYSVNPTAANMFLQYLCEADIAYDCMDYVGSTTAVMEAANNYKADVIADEDGFFANTYEGFKEMYVEMMFPSSETLKRCAIMRDFGSYNKDLDEMWMDVILG